MKLLPDWDARHRLSLSGTWTLPSPRGFLKYVVGGWEIGSVAILQSGNPLTIFTDAPFDPLIDSWVK